MAAAAKALGLSRVTVETTLARYHERVCDRRFEELEAELAPLRDRDRRKRVAERERELFPVSHHRIADGGTRVKEQLRRARRPPPACDPASGSVAGDP